MSLGRIKRDRKKIKYRANIDRNRGRPGRKIRVSVYVNRDNFGTGSYEAQACFGPAASLRTAHKSCGRKTSGRTPQSAIGKALKALGVSAAKRSY